MKTLLIARKSLVEIFREPQLIGLVLAMPLLFLLITKAGYSRVFLPTHPIQLVGESPAAQALASNLVDLTYADGRNVFELYQTTDQAAAKQAAAERETTAVVIVEPWQAGQPLQTTLHGDATFGPFYRASLLIESVIRQTSAQLSGDEIPLVVTEKSIFRAGPLTEFDLYTPGMIIFGWLMIIPQTAMLVSREIRWRTLRRLRLTPLSTTELLGGFSLAQLVIAVFLVVLVIGGALALGFHLHGSIWLAALIGLVLCISSIGQGLIVAGFVENDSQAANVGSTFAMIQVFLSGSFYQLPPITLFQIGEQAIDLFDIFPATHGLQALQQVMVYGATLPEIRYRLIAMIALSILIFIFGIALFRKSQMKNVRS